MKIDEKNVEFVALEAEILIRVDPIVVEIAFIFALGSRISAISPPPEPYQNQIRLVTQ